LSHLPSDYTAILVPQKRWQQRSDVVSLLPSALGLFTDQMETAGCDRIAFEQALTLSLACRVIWREALVFGMSQVLGEDHIEGLYQHQRGL
jgi:hypothetical protein